MSRQLAAAESTPSMDEVENIERNCNSRETDNLEESLISQDIQDDFDEVLQMLTEYEEQIQTHSNHVYGMPENMEENKEGENVMLEVSCKRNFLETGH